MRVSLGKFSGNPPEKKFKNPKTQSVFTESQVAAMILKVVKEARGLTDWEKTFVPSIAANFTNTRFITEPQLVSLESIYSNKTGL